MVTFDEEPRPQSPVTKATGVREVAAIAAWIAHREAGNVEAACSLCSPTLVVEPLKGGAIEGIDRAKASVFVKPAQPPTEIIQPLQPMDGVLGGFFREVVFTAAFLFKAKVRQEWYVINTGDGVKITKIALTKLP